MEQISEYTQFVESIKKEIDVSLNFRAECYEYFNSKFRKESGMVTGLSYEEYEEGMIKMLRLRQQTYNLLLDSKIFILEEDIAQMLYLTDNEIFPRKIPFDNLFLETSFNLENGSIIKGIHIFKEEKSGVVLGVVRIYYPDCPIPATLHFDLFSKNLKPKQEGETEGKLIDSMNNTERFGKLKGQSKKIQMFVCNFLDFLNDPEVELRTYERTEKNRQRRIRDGKIPIPPINFITVTGKLKIYQDSLSEGIHFSYSYKFWVRGHFRRLQDEERYGEQSGKRIWIKPYIKGKGILKDKNYKLKKQTKRGGKR
jgi:hypothetical protein